MPRLPRWTAIEAERALLDAGFELLRSKGSHRIYGNGILRVTIPFHTGAVLHPKNYQASARNHRRGPAYDARFLSPHKRCSDFADPFEVGF